MLTWTALLFIALLPDIAPTHHLVGEQTWAHQEKCVRRMRQAVARLDEKLPRFAGRWSVDRSPELVELQMELGGIVGMVYLDLATDRLVRAHPRKPTGPWTPEKDKGPFTVSKRRTGADQGAWIAWSAPLTPSEGRTYEAIVAAALDDCVLTFDPVYRIARWTPNHGRLWFELVPKF